MLMSERSGRTDRGKYRLGVCEATIRRNVRP